jgi:hypothetical protein
MGSCAASCFICRLAGWFAFAISVVSPTAGAAQLSPDVDPCSMRRHRPICQNCLVSGALLLSNHAHRGSSRQARQAEGFFVDDLSGVPKERETRPKQVQRSLKYGCLAVVIQTAR